MSTDASWLRQFLCGLQGHDELRQFEKGRLSLKCMWCGHESPGWDLRKAQVRETREPRPAAWRRFVPHAFGARRLAS
jgi:hypothetical protein